MSWHHTVYRRQAWHCSYLRCLPSSTSSLHCNHRHRCSASHWVSFHWRDRRYKQCYLPGHRYWRDKLSECWRWDRYVGHQNDMGTFDDSDLQAVEREDSVCAGPKGKATGESTGLKEKPDVSGKKKRRRGPPRPHRQVPDDVLTQRLSKLQKRVDKAKIQLADATRQLLLCCQAEPCGGTQERGEGPSFTQRAPRPSTASYLPGFRQRRKTRQFPPGLTA